MQDLTGTSSKIQGIASSAFIFSFPSLILVEYSGRVQTCLSTFLSVWCSLISHLIPFRVITCKEIGENHCSPCSYTYFSLAYFESFFTQECRRECKCKGYVLNISCTPVKGHLLRFGAIYVQH